MEIAAAIERGITSQSELITSLSLALIGGLLVFFLRIRLHNATHPSSAIPMRRFGLCLLSLGAAGVAIVLGYVVAGMLIQMAPQLFSHSFEVTKSFSAQDFGPAPINWLQIVSLIQFLVFLGAVAAGVLFVLSNRE